MAKVLDLGKIDRGGGGLGGFMWISAKTSPLRSASSAQSAVHVGFSGFTAPNLTIRASSPIILLSMGDPVMNDEQLFQAALTLFLVWPYLMNR
jgi:hypothetical protein